MKQKYFFFFIFILVAAFFCPPNLLAARESAGGIAYIDSQRVVDESSAGKTSLKELEEFKKENEEELAKRAKEIDGVEEELQKKKFALSPDARSQMEESIRRKNIDLKRFKEDKEQELKDLYFKHLTKIKEDIIQIVQKIGQEKGYSIIFNRDDSVIYASPTCDVTDLVIEAYNKTLSKEPAK
jgi:outer membrane protein